MIRKKRLTSLLFGAVTVTVLLASMGNGGTTGGSQCQFGGVNLPSDYAPIVTANATGAFTTQILAGQLYVEDGPVFGWNPYQRSPVGAIGPCQFMPGTWKQWGNGGDPTNPSDCIPAMVHYDTWLYNHQCGGSRDGALEAYNSGRCDGNYSYASEINSMAGGCSSHQAASGGGGSQAHNRGSQPHHAGAYRQCYFNRSRTKARCLTLQNKWVRLVERGGKWYGAG